MVEAVAGTAESSNKPPDATQLALERTRLAHDRTLMAWVRTATSLISFGFTIYKFFEYLRQSGQKETSEARVGPRQYGMIMISIGIFALVLATFQHYQFMRKVRRWMQEEVFSLALVPAALISLLGILSLLAVWFRY